MNKKHIFFLSILAVGIFALGVYIANAEDVSIQVGNTTISFLPLVITTKAADPPSGALYVFSSTATTGGNPGGRSALGSMCQADDPESHPCNYYEVDKALENQGVFFEHPLQTSRLDSVADVWELSYPCNGWTENSVDIYDGLIILENATGVYWTTCDQNYPVACCKWMP